MSHEDNKSTDTGDARSRESSVLNKKQKLGTRLMKSTRNVGAIVLHPPTALTPEHTKLHELVLPPLSRQLDSLTVTNFKRRDAVGGAPWTN